MTVFHYFSPQNQHASPPPAHPQKNNEGNITTFPLQVTGNYNQKFPGFSHARLQPPS
jgi:hypothetical protein